LFRYFSLGYLLLVAVGGFMSPVWGAPTFEITDKLKQQSLQNHLDLYIDDNSTIDQVAILSLDKQTEFIPANYYRLKKLPKDTTVWLRFSLYNNSDNQRITLRIHPYTIDQYTLYSLDQQHLTLLA
jgi:hypothetical protein